MCGGGSVCHVHIKDLSCQSKSGIDTPVNWIGLHIRLLVITYHLLRMERHVLSINKMHV